MERNIKSEIDIFLDNLKLGIILKNSDKIRNTLTKNMPIIKGVNKIQEAMGLHKLAFQILKEENNNLSKEMSILNKGTKLHKTIMPNTKNPIYKIKT
jgi:serine phosphatase RsbU (regulator of sigma subunit)